MCSCHRQHPALLNRPSPNLLLFVCGCEQILFVDSAYQTIHLQDVGPINVPLSTNVRLVDFGTAVHAGAEKPSIVVSRSYRAVEIVLGIGWGSGVDVWAIGCVLMELYTGHRLFNIGSGSDDDHLKQMEALLGHIPISLLTLPRVYPQGGGGSAPTSAPGSPVWGAGGTVGTAPGGQQTGRLRDRIMASDVQFCDLIERMLTFDPAQRITARQALQHPYFLASSE
jgi:dual-specificity kinase